MLPRRKYRLLSQKTIAFVSGESFPDGNPDQYLTPQIDFAGTFVKVSAYQPGLDPDNDADQLRRLCDDALSTGMLTINL